MVTVDLCPLLNLHPHLENLSRKFSLAFILMTRCFWFYPFFIQFCYPSFSSGPKTLDNFLNPQRSAEEMETIKISYNESQKMSYTKMITAWTSYSAGSMELAHDISCFLLSLLIDLFIFVVNFLFHTAHISLIKPLRQHTWIRNIKAIIFLLKGVVYCYIIW